MTFTALKLLNVEKLIFFPVTGHYMCRFSYLTLDDTGDPPRGFYKRRKHATPGRLHPASEPSVLRKTSSRMPDQNQQSVHQRPSLPGRRKEAGPSERMRGLH